MSAKTTKAGNPFAVGVKKTRAKSEKADAFAKGEISANSETQTVTPTNPEPQQTDLSRTTAASQSKSSRSKLPLKQENDVTDPLVSFNVKITASRRRKLKRVAAERDTTITQLLNAWVDAMPED